MVVSCCGYIYMDANGMFFQENDNGIETSVFVTDMPNDSASEIGAHSDDGLVGNNVNDFGDEDYFDEPDGDWIVLEAVENALADYQYNNSVEREFVSRNGYFYDYVKNKFVTIKDLINAEVLDEKYANEDVMLLYLRPSDFRNYREVDFGIAPELRVFAGKQTLEGIELFCSGMKGLVYRENFNEILSYYLMEETAVTKPEANDEDFRNALKTVSEFNGESESNYYVRYINCDGNHAIIAVSSKTSPTKIKGYVLERDGTSFNVIFDGFDDIEKVNNAAADVNLELLPPTMLRAFNLYSAEKYANITDDLLAKEKVFESDLPVAFICGTDEFVYIEYSSDKKYLGELQKDRSWKLDPCQTRKSAREKLKELSGNPPWMIIPM